MLPKPSAYCFNGESISTERWQWEAHYNNGLVLKQFDDYGLFHQLKEIQQWEMDSFRMVHRYGVCSPIVIKWRPEYELIHFYRNQFSNNSPVRIRLYCFGYKYDSIKVVLTIMPDDTVIINST